MATCWELIEKEMPGAQVNPELFPNLFQAFASVGED